MSDDTLVIIFATYITGLLSLALIAFIGIDSWEINKKFSITIFWPIWLLGYLVSLAIKTGKWIFELVIHS